MSVFVDDARNKLGRMRMSHLIADTAVEAMQMMVHLGINTLYVQPPMRGRCAHFDICQAKRTAAIAAGAVPVSQRKLARLSRLREMMR